VGGYTLMKILIDCGFNVGKYTKKILAEEQFDKIYAFEPNSIFLKKWQDRNLKNLPPITLINAAIHTYDGTIDFFDGRSSENSSIFNDKGHLKGTKKTVNCVDFDAWFRKTVKEDDYVHLKIDVEGAEYLVVPKMIESGSILMVDTLVVEWHWKKRRGHPDKVVHDQIQKFLAEHPEIKLLPWW
jgi:FkbM family methyltransferase